MLTRLTRQNQEPVRKTWHMFACLPIELNPHISQWRRREAFTDKATFGHGNSSNQSSIKLNT